MPCRLTHAKRKLTSSTTRDYSGSSKSKGPKVLKLLQMQEQKRQLNERQKKTELSKFFITFCWRICIDITSTGLTTNLCQKIVEMGMIAGKSLSEVDWTIIPDIPNTSILDEYMNTVSQMDEWEDVVEDNLAIDVHDEMDKTAARQTTLQTTITCIILIFLCLFSFLNLL